ncbi:MAG: ABC transporter [Sphingomonas sp.]|nr:ABC transporter [Sphingomonas sp.]|tara:strand:- start:146 stop:727 length:582 start_codon:yes stop_codon:yes gene_type:complete
MKKLAIVAALLPLTACIKFGSEPPPALLMLSSAVTVPAGEIQGSANSAAILIQTPQTPQELATVRVPVHTSDTSVAYVKEAQWVEQPADMFARLLADTVTARTGRMTISERQSIDRPAALLTGELRSFGVDARTNEATVIYDASLRRADSGVFERRRFVATVPVSAIDRTAVGEALNQAANQVAGEVADWIGK